MIELYKILSGKYDTSVSNFIELNNSDTRGHQYKIQKKHIRLDIRKRSFPHRCTNMWNNLADNIVSSKTVKMFESRLDRLWRDAEFKYNFEADPPISVRTTVVNSDTDLDLIEEANYGLRSEDFL